MRLVDDNGTSWLPAELAAVRAQCSTQTIWRLRRTGVLRVQRHRGRTWFREDDVAALVSATENTDK